MTIISNENCDKNITYLIGTNNGGTIIIGFAIVNLFMIFGAFFKVLFLF